MTVIKNKRLFYRILSHGLEEKEEAFEFIIRSNVRPENCAILFVQRRFRVIGRLTIEEFNNAPYAHKRKWLISLKSNTKRATKWLKLCRSRKANRAYVCKDFFDEHDVRLAAIKRRRKHEEEKKKETECS